MGRRGNRWWVLGGAAVGLGMEGEALRKMTFDGLEKAW